MRWSSLGALVTGELLADFSLYNYKYELAGQAVAALCLWTAFIPPPALNLLSCPKLLPPIPSSLNLCALPAQGCSGWCTSPPAALICLCLSLQVYCLDVQFVAEMPKFIAGSMSALSAMVQLELPHVNVLTKMDLCKDKVGGETEALTLAETEG